MKCPYCGYENSEGAAICEMCEMPLQQLTRKRQHGRPETPQTQKADRPIRVHQLEEQFEIPSVGCPNCGTSLCDCAPIVKTTVKSSGGGYGLFSGCCGTILLGPLGLLCGLRTIIRNTLSQEEKNLAKNCSVLCYEDWRNTQVMKWRRNEDPVRAANSKVRSNYPVL